MVGQRLGHMDRLSGRLEACKGSKNSDRRASHWRGCRLMTSILENYTPVPEAGCWLWLGCWHVRGYGKTGGHDGSRIAHRVFFEAHKGAIPEGLFVCHKCDTPSCVNPDHLFAGTAAENGADAANKGRGREARGEKNSSAKLTERQVLAIFNDPRPEREVADEFGVSAGTVTAIKNGRAWRHLNLRNAKP